MMLVGHVLDHMPDHVLDHMIIGLVTPALQSQANTYCGGLWKKSKNWEKVGM